MEKLRHVSVLLDECIEALHIRPDGLYADGTTGGGGHSLEIVKRLKSGRLLCIDQDDFAQQRARERLAEYLEKITFVKDNFKNIRRILAEQRMDGLDGMLLDLGVSSFQLDDGARGFSYQKEAPLDMRMDKQQRLTAREVVNEYSWEELTRVIREYGEEKFAPRIATRICEARRTAPVERTTELAELVKEAIPAAARREGGHPAKRTFQAIRIEVNGELSILRQAVLDIAEELKSGGRLAVITFHSLEDRIVKSAFAELASGCTCPKDFPVCVCGKKPRAKILTKKPILPSAEELAENNRARSAKLRVLEKI